MPVVFLITIVAVLVGIFFAATGRGGELAYEQADHAPLDLGPVSAADVALLRPPTALWGYNMQVTDEALDQIARAVRERDVTIAYLQERLASVEGIGSYSEPMEAHARQAAGLAPAPGPSGLPEAPAEAETLENSQAVGPFYESRGLLDYFLHVDTPETAEHAETLEAADTSEAMETDEAAETDEASESFEAAPSAEDTEAAELPPHAEAAEPPPYAETAETETAEIETAEMAEMRSPPRTPLVLKASAAKTSPAPESYEVTQPNEVLQNPEPPEATQPSGIEDPPTQPSAPLAPDEAYGPQGDFNAHGWWAEQREAARQEDAEEQGW